MILALTMKRLTMMMFGVALSLIPTTTAHVTMRLRSEALLKAWVHINFYGDTFTNFYQCLSSRRSVTCMASLARDGKEPSKVNERRVVVVQKPETDNDREDFSDYFVCQLTFPEEQVACRRLKSEEVKCSSRTYTQHFRLLNDSTCVVVIWNSLGESFIGDSRPPTVDLCGSGCKSTSRNTSRTRYPITPTVSPSLQDNDDDEDDHRRSHPRHSIDDNLDTKSHIILTVVISLSVAAVLVVAAAFFRRKLLQKSIPPRADDQTDKTDKTASRGKKAGKSVLSRSVSTEVSPGTTSIVLDPFRLSSNI